MSLNPENDSETDIFASGDSTEFSVETNAAEALEGAENDSMAQTGHTVHPGGVG